MRITIRGKMLSYKRIICGNETEGFVEVECKEEAFYANKKVVKIFLYEGFYKRFPLSSGDLVGKEVEIEADYLDIFYDSGPIVKAISIREFLAETSQSAPSK